MSIFHGRRTVSIMLVDRLAHDMCSQPQPDTERILRLALRSPETEKAIRRAVRRASRDLSRATVDEITDQVRSKVHAALGRSIMGTPGAPPTFHPSKVADGASFSGWLDRFCTPVAAHEVASFLRSWRPATPIDPTDLADLEVPWMVPSAARAREDLIDQIAQGLHHDQSALRGSSRHLRLANALARGLNLKPLMRPTFEGPHQRSEFLSWVATDEGVAAVVFALGRIASGKETACPIRHLRVVEQMVSHHKVSELRRLLDQQDVVLRQMLTAAAVPRPVPKQSLCQQLIANLQTQNPQAVPGRITKLVRTWATAAAELEVSEWRDPNAAEKTPQQRQVEWAKFSSCAVDAADNTTTFAGMTPVQISARLDEMFNALEQAAVAHAEEIA